jgi:alpha-L-rhamnosidase
MKRSRLLHPVVFIMMLQFFLVSCHTGDYSDISVTDLRVNDESSPAGIDTREPAFSWKLISGQRNRVQSAYQIVVLVKNSSDTIWNSGKVLSDQQFGVKYKGLPLNPVQAFHWKVRIWDQDAKISRWSDESDFTMGLLDETDWTGEWISSPGSVYSPVFIREFQLDKLPVDATVFVNCQGYYELFVNGQKVGNDVLSPAVSDFRFENYYLTYDIGKYLKKGENTLGVWTGRGWYSMGLPGVVHGSPVIRLQAHLDYGRGTDTEVIVSDTTWLTFESNIRQIGRWRWNQMGGELIDGTFSMNNWQEGIAKGDPKYATVISKPPAQTRAQLCRRNIISDTLQVQDIKAIGENIWLVDFGRNFTGWMEMKIRNQSPGDTIDFIYSDFCNKIPERRSTYRWDFGNEYIDQRNGYICSGSAEENFCPKFNFSHSGM